MPAAVTGLVGVLAAPLVVHGLVCAFRVAPERRALRWGLAALVGLEAALIGASLMAYGNLPAVYVPSRKAGVTNDAMGIMAGAVALEALLSALIVREQQRREGSGETVSAGMTALMYARIGAAFAIMMLFGIGRVL